VAAWPKTPVIMASTLLDWDVPGQPRLDND
jgi:hypothetical protein